MQALVGDSLDALTKLAEAHQGTGMQARASSLPEPGLQSSGSSKCDWWEGARVVRGGLAQRFSAGHLDARWLWRHAVLNPTDRAPCAEDIRRLDALVEGVNAALNPVTDLVERVRLQEMVDSVRSGGIEPWQGEVSETQLESIARNTLRERRKAGLEGTLEDVVAELRAAGVGKAPAASHVMVDGAYYLQASFRSLPRTEAIRGAVSLCASHAASLVIGFFVYRGYTTWTTEIDAVFVGLSRGQPALDRRTQLPAAGR